MRSVHIIVHGLVQGVFFRQHTQEKALELGINGFVRNIPDGTVEIDATGTNEALETLVAWCKEGPPHAEVTYIDMHEVPLKNFSSFKIIR